MCKKPIQIKNPKTNTFIDVPCGICMECRLQKKQAIVNRVFLESLNSWKYSFFISLTYDPKNVPLTSCGKSVIKKSDFQNFLKRLKRITGNDIAYLYCAEYGDQFLRSHFHVILFSNVFFNKKELEKIWDFGFVSIGTVTNASINYVASYVTKRENFNPKDIKTFKCPYNFIPEYSRCSNHLGLGYVYDNLEYFLNNGFHVNGKTVPFPRYFLENVSELKLKQFFAQFRKDTQHFNKYDIQRTSKLIDIKDNYDYLNSSNHSIFKEV